MADFLFSGCSDNYQFIVNDSELPVSVDIGSYWYFTGETDVSPFVYSGCVYLESSGTTIPGYPSYSAVSLTYYGNTDCQSCINDNNPITPAAGDVYYVFSACCEDGYTFEVQSIDFVAGPYVPPDLTKTYYLTGKTSNGPTFSFSGCASILFSAETSSSLDKFTIVTLVDQYDTCGQCIAVYPCAVTPTPTQTPTITPTITPSNTVTQTPTNTTTQTPTQTPTSTTTQTPTVTPTNTQTPEASLTPTPSQTTTQTPTPTNTQTPESSLTPTPTNTNTPTPTSTTAALLDPCLLIVISKGSGYLFDPSTLTFLSSPKPYITGLNGVITKSDARLYLARLTFGFPPYQILEYDITTTTPTLLNTITCSGGETIRGIFYKSTTELYIVNETTLQIEVFDLILGSVTSVVCPLPGGYTLTSSVQNYCNLYFDSLNNIFYYTLIPPIGIDPDDLVLCAIDPTTSSVILTSPIIPGEVINGVFIHDNKLYASSSPILIGATNSIYEITPSTTNPGLFSFSSPILDITSSLGIFDSTTSIFAQWPDTGCTDQIAPSICPISEYCVNLYNTAYSGYSDIYINTGLIYNGYNYFTGQTTGYFIYYSPLSLSWCLSETLGGSCVLFGQSPCENICPDLDESFMSQGICPTPTPTQTSVCDIDFDILFNCDFIPTPSNTPTSTVTPTVTPTPTQTILCPVSIDVSISNVSSTPTPTPTPTPSFGPGGQCEIFGVVTYESLNGYIICDGSKNWFTDCETGDDYYTASPAVFGGSPLTVLNVYSGVIDFGPYNETKCLIYKGIVQFDTFGPNITITNSHGTDCDSCSPVPPPSQTPTVTPSITPTKTVTPTPSRSFSDVVYGRYFVIKNCYGGEYFVQPVLTAPNGVQLEVGDSFGWSKVAITTPNPNGYYENYTCWWYVGSYYGTLNGFTPNGGPRWGGLIPFPVPLGVGVYPNNVDYFTTYVQSIGFTNSGFNPLSPFKGTGNNDQCDECCAQLNTVCNTQFADP